MLNIKNDLPKQVQTKRTALLPDRLADAVDLLLPRAAEVALLPSDFIAQTRERPVVSTLFSIKLITERASTTTQLLLDIHERSNAHSHWGLNE